MASAFSRSIETGFFRLLIVAAALIAVLASLPAAAAESRMALVIGNGAYSYGALDNAVNDAADTADALRSVGFEVTLVTDADQRAMDEAVDAFAEALRAKGGVGLFYFSGHGVQVDDENYALPIGEGLESEADAKYRAVNLGAVVDKLSAAKNDLNIVILDACRNNPLKSSGRSTTRGLARVDGGAGLFVSFSTAPGAVALDGEGRNSPFTAHLVEAIRTPGLSLEEAFKQTLKGTYTGTNGEQTPWISSSFFGNFVFSDAGTAVAALSAPAETPPPPSAKSTLNKTEVAARAAGFLPVAGIYRASGTNPNGTRYEGMTAVSLEGGVYRFTWWIGKDVFQGTGRLAGRMLVVDWGANAPVIYTLQPNGALDGEWADGRATEILEPFALAAYGRTLSVGGSYSIEGANPDGSQYTGAVNISRDGNGYSVRWRVGEQSYGGLGKLDGNLLVVDWGDATPVVYAVADDGALSGLWAGGKGTELLTPER